MFYLGKFDQSESWKFIWSKIIILRSPVQCCQDEVIAVLTVNLAIKLLVKFNVKVLNNFRLHVEEQYQ